MITKEDNLLAYVIRKTWGVIDTRKSWIQGLQWHPRSPLPILCHAGPCLSLFSDRLSHHILDEMVSSKPPKHVRVYQLFEKWFPLRASVRNCRRQWPRWSCAPPTAVLVQHPVRLARWPPLGLWGRGWELGSRGSPIGTIRSSFPAENVVFRGSIARSREASKPHAH